MAQAAVENRFADQIQQREAETEAKAHALAADEASQVVIKLNELMDGRKGKELLDYINSFGSSVQQVMNKQVFPLDLRNILFQGIGVTLMAKAIIQARDKDRKAITEAMIKLGGKFDDVAFDMNKAYTQKEHKVPCYGVRIDEVPEFMSNNTSQLDMPTKLAKYSGSTVTNLIFQHTCFNTDLLEYMNSSGVTLSGPDIMFVAGHGQAVEVIKHFDSDRVNIEDLQRVSRESKYSLFQHAVRSDKWDNVPDRIDFCCLMVKIGYKPTRDELNFIEEKLYSGSLGKYGADVAGRLDILSKMLKDLNLQKTQVQQDIKPEVADDDSSDAAAAQAAPAMSDGVTAPLSKVANASAPSAPALPAAPAGPDVPCKFISITLLPPEAEGGLGNRDFAKAAAAAENMSDAALLLQDAMLPHEENVPPGGEVFYNDNNTE